MRFCREQSHEFDECRFDVSVNNCVWYLRAENPEDKMHWIEVLQSYKPLSGIGFDTASLRRHGSTISLQSNSLMANPSLGVGGLREKIAEMETFRDILSGQLNTLQRYVIRALISVCLEIPCKHNNTYNFQLFRCARTQEWHSM